MHFWQECRGSDIFLSVSYLETHAVGVSLLVVLVNDGLIIG